MWIKVPQEKIIQADNVEADIGGERGRDGEQNTGKRGAVKICEDHQEERIV